MDGAGKVESPLCSAAESTAMDYKTTTAELLQVPAFLREPDRMHTIQPNTECPPTCSDSGPNGPASPSHPHGQTDLLRVLVGVPTEVPEAVEHESHLHASHLNLLMRALVDVPHAEGRDIGMRYSLMYHTQPLSTSDS